MATKEQVLVAVKQAKANRDAAERAGRHNLAPYSQITLRFPKEIQTERFKLAAGETWDSQFKNFGDDHVVIGHSQILFRRFEIVGLAYPFKEKAHERKAQGG